MSELALERREQAEGGIVSPTISITPLIGEDYWSYRVIVADGQAVVGFPKFSTVGIGFAVEDDWNTNLPWGCWPEAIYEHIKHNAYAHRADLMAAAPDEDDYDARLAYLTAGDGSIPAERVLAAIRLIQDAVESDRPDLHAGRDRLRSEPYSEVTA